MIQMVSQDFNVEYDDYVLRIVATLTSILYSADAFL